MSVFDLPAAGRQAQTDKLRVLQQPASVDKLTKERA